MTQRNPRRREDDSRGPVQSGAQQGQLVRPLKSLLVLEQVGHKWVDMHAPVVSER